MKKVILSIDGGIGRVICSVPAIETFCRNNPGTEVITPWPGIFMNNPNIPVVHDAWGDKIKPLWYSTIRNGDFRHPEPYHHHLYYTKQHHLIQSFDHILNGTSNFTRPQLHLTEEELRFGQDLVEAIKKSQGAKKVILFQPFGGSAQAQGNFVIDTTYRSLSKQTAIEILTNLPSDTKAIYRGTLPFSHRNCLAKNDFSLRETLSLVAACDMVVGIDSCIQHMAYALGKRGVILWGATAVENVGYKEDFINISRPGYPREYVPFRFDFDHNVNGGAMDFSPHEVQNICSNVVSLLQGVSS